MRQLLVFILFAGLLCWSMFSPIYKHVVIMRQAVLQKEVDYLLEVGCSAKYGYIDFDMLAASKKRLAERGFNEADVKYEITTTNGADGTNQASPILRGEGIQIVISYPYEHLFEIDQLLGITGPKPSDLMSASGLKMSEYVP
jgi:diphthamide synthase subunit DPH2